MIIPLFCPSFLHHRQWVTPLKWQSASGWWMLVRPMTFGDSKGDTGQNNFNPFGRVFRAYLAYFNSCHPIQVSWISKILEPNKLVGSIIFWKMPVRSEEFSLLKCGLFARKYYSLTFCTSLVVPVKGLLATP